MFTYIFVSTYLFLLIAIVFAIKIDDSKNLQNFVGAFLSLGLAIWGLALIILNWG